MEKYIDKAKPLYFQVLMVLITLISSSSYLRIKIGSYAVYGLAFGIVICVVTLFDGTFKRVICDKINWLLFAFCAFYFVSILLSRQSGLSDNLKQLVFMSVFFYLFTMVTYKKNNDEKKHDLIVVSWVYVILTFCVSLVSFYMYLIGFSSLGVDPETNQYYEIGMVWIRLAGLYNPNTSASIFTTSFIISLLLVIGHRDGRKGVIERIGLTINVINMIVEYFCIILTASRGATYSFYIALVFLLFVILFVNLRLKKSLKKICVCLILCVIFLALLIGLSEVTQEGLSYFPSLFENNSSVTASISFYPKVLEINVEKTNIERDYAVGITTGRIDIWKAGLALIKENILFGIPYSSLKDLGSCYFYDRGISVDYLNAGGTFHNILLSCLASSGILGFIPIFIFVVVRVLNAIKVSLKQKSFDAIYVLPLIVIVMALANEMVESRILYSVNILNVMFWIMMGYLPNEKKDAA